MIKPNRTKSIIPDPEEWIKEHYVLASFANTLSTLKQLLGDEETQVDHKISYTHEGELILGVATRNLLKEAMVMTIGNMSKITYQSANIKD